MKVLLNCHVPFQLAHGGAQFQIEQTWAALEKIGVTVEPLRWWDGAQRGDILHHFGRLPANHARFAKAKGMKVVASDLLTEQGSRSRAQLFRKKMLRQIVERVPALENLMGTTLDSYRLADALLVMTPWERHLMNYLYGATLDKVFIVPNGMDEIFLKPAPPPAERGRWLLCTATITPRKRVVELAQAAVQAETPLWIVGKPYADADSYAQQFYSLARTHPQLICCDSPPLADREGLAKIYRAARGFVLLSAMETRSLAAEEAAACECPLLLSDLPWARTTFGDAAQYCSINGSTEKTAAALRAFYAAAPSLPRPPKPPTWIGIAEQLKSIYETIGG